MVDATPLISYLRVQRATEREIIAILRRSADSIDRELRTLTGSSRVGDIVRREQLLMTQAAIHREIAVLWRALGLVVEAGRAEAAAAAVELIMTPSLLRAAMPRGRADEIIRAAEAAARSTVATVEARVNLSSRPLAESVYRSQDLVDGRIDELINSALARGASADELARDVRGFVRPDVRGGVRYAAMRLARTELNNAFHAQQIQSGIESPWVTGMKWNLSGSHPVPDECNVYAETQHEKGGEVGVFKPENVPGKPHPNCLCYMTSVTVEQDSFVSSFLSGEYDGFIDSFMRAGSFVAR